MSSSDRSNSSGNYHFQDDDVGMNGATIEYHDAPAAIPYGNTPSEISSDTTPVDAPSQSLSQVFSSENNDQPAEADPNIGMVIVRMDDGGPRPKRTKASEIVIPLDPVSSSEIVKDSPVEDDSSTDDKSPKLTAGVNRDSCEFSNEIVDNESICSNDCNCTKTECSSSNSESAQSTECDSENEDSRDDFSDINDSETSPEDNTDDEDNDIDKVDENASDTIARSIRSPSNCDRVGISERSFVNLCKRFQNGTARYEEIIDARDRLGRQILRTYPNHPLSSHIALRMFSSVTTNFKLKDIGYVNLDSLPATSDTCPVINQDPSGVGDVFDIPRENDMSVSADETPIENESTSPVCSTRADFTPAAHSKTEETTNEIQVCSVQSGRENPQAKYDSEVRPNNPNMPPSSFRHKMIKEVLPPIPKSAGRSRPHTTDVQSHNAAKMLTTSKPTAGLKSVNKPLMVKHEIHNRRQCPVAKPGIPYQLRSVACYRDGKVDVSITGDKRLIPESEPLDVNITFIHKSVSNANKEVNAINEEGEKKLSSLRREPFPLPAKCISPYHPTERKTQSNVISLSSKRPLPPLKHVLKTEKNDFGQLSNISKFATGSRFPNRKALPPLRNISGRERRLIPVMERKIKAVSTDKHKKSTRKYENLNWNIVNDRAHRPPFNTHINPEASERHQKIFANIPV